MFEIRLCESVAVWERWIGVAGGSRRGALNLLTMIQYSTLKAVMIPAKPGAQLGGFEASMEPSRQKYNQRY